MFVHDKPIQPRIRPQIPAIIRYIVGPFPEMICHVDTILRNFYTMQGLLFLDAMTLVRYIFLFHIKNPAALQDDFWDQCH